MKIDPRLPALLLSSLAFAACGGGTSPADSAGSDTAPAASDGGAEPGADSAPSAAPTLGGTPSPADARLYFIAPADGATVTSPVRVEFGLDNMEVVPAGTEAPASGHHHVIIDTELPPFDLPIPADANHVHYGSGASAAELELAPGTHTLQLLLGDHLHVPHDPPVYSERITITVEAGDAGGG